VNPALGRVFGPGEERESLAVISHAFWQRRFGGERDVVGRSLVLEGQAARIVGVMPPGFDFPATGGATQLWFPKPIDPQNLDCWCWVTLGRLAPGRSPGDAAREIARLSDDFWREREHKPALSASEESKTVVFAVPLAQTLVGEVETPLLVLLGAVLLVLLIACANLANLLLARATARAREIAMRCCLGASPWRVARQLFVESLLLAGAGALSGLALAYFALRALAPLVLARVPHLQSLGLDPKAAALTLGLAFTTALVVGLAPALRAARTDVHEAVKEGSRGSGGPRSQRLGRAFVVAQLALSLVLLVGAGLLLRSFRNLMEVDLGFRPEGVLVARVSLPSAPPPDAARERQFYGQLAERVGALPGVRGIGLASIAPFSDGDNGQIFTIRGREPRPTSRTWWRASASRRRGTSRRSARRSCAAERSTPATEKAAPGWPSSTTCSPGASGRTATPSATRSGWGMRRARARGFRSWASSRPSSTATSPRTRCATCTCRSRSSTPARWTSSCARPPTRRCSRRRSGARSRASTRRFRSTRSTRSTPPWHSRSRRAGSPSGCSRGSRSRRCCSPRWGSTA
jgi:predicted permease